MDLEQKLFEATVKYFILNVAFQLLNDETYTKEAAAKELIEWLRHIELD